VADMDFRTAPSVAESLSERVRTGIFGYTHVSEEYFEALTSWFKRRHGWNIDKDMVIYTSGVVPAISAIIKAFTHPGDGVILQTPAYNCFFSSIRNNGCREYDNPLRRIDSGMEFSYEIDFENLDRLASDPRNKLLILCNPHNPSGRVWTKDELVKVRDICLRNNVRVVSDEIHCELTHQGHEYIPYANIDKEAIVCCSPSKAFNTAGLQIANIVCPDETSRCAVDRAINDNEVCDVNPFGVIGLIAAYNKGEDWLDDLNEYLAGNRELLIKEISSHIPQWKICKSESTYLAWIDISGSGMNGDEMESYLKREGKVLVSSGSIYGAEDYIRINYATARPRLEEALKRITSAIKKL
ncbi:MAG: pyridoxal phosphate-dependent aminotransferase, partial [Muribaculaceae bacterium]|nr:pyridoxal phosphate-dependent aminotransferase [Muribaculaceae bacterium]